jgi:hypothetical protein
MAVKGKIAVMGSIDTADSSGLGHGATAVWRSGPIITITSVPTGNGWRYVIAVLPKLNGSNTRRIGPFTSNTIE